MPRLSHNVAVVETTDAAALTALRRAGALWRWLMPRLSHNAAVVETTDAAALTALLAGGLDRMVVRRLSDRAVMVDHQRLDDVRKLLRRLGHTPRITRE